MKKQSFVKGAMILMIANAISKILGAVFKIPLTYILHEDGMAIFNTAFSVYIMVLSFIVSGMPLAISKMVAEEIALNRKSSVKRIIRVSTILLSILGIIGTLIMYFGAGVFARAMNDMKAVYAIQCISPAVFFVAVGVVYKSYYQGSQNMIPTAVSQVIEAIIKLGVGYVLASYLCVFSMEVTASGAILGVTIGEVLATAILIMMYRPEKCDKKEKAMSTKKILKNIFCIAVPMIFAASVSGVISFIDTAVIRNMLQKVVFEEKDIFDFMIRYGPYTNVFDDLKDTMKITADGARWLYGAYSGYALTIFHLPTGIMGAFCSSIFPVIAGAMAVGNKFRVGYTISLAMRIIFLITLPCAVVIFVFAEPMLDVLFNNTASALLLKTVAPCLIFLCVSQLCTASLQASGKIMTPFLYSFLSSIIKLIGNIVLIRIPQLNIQGAVISTNICYFFEMMLALYFTKKYLCFNIDVVNMILKPVISTIVMGIVMYLVYTPMCIIFVKELLALGATLCLGAITYLLMLGMTSAVSLKEIKTFRKHI